MKSDAALDGFVAESLAAERCGGFAPYLERTRPVARGLVRRLLHGADGGEGAPCGPRRRGAGTSPASPAPSSGGALLGFIAHVAAPFLGGGVAAAAATLASAAAGVAGAVASPLGVLAAAVAGAIGGDADDADAGDSIRAAVPAGGAAAASVRRSVTLRFRSATREAALRWQANLHIPVAGEGNVVVRLVEPRQAVGTFHFCGISVPIAMGRGEIPLSAIRAGLSRGGVAFALPDASPVPGAPFLEVAEK